MNEWQKVYQDQLEYRAKIVKAILQEHDMNPVLVNKKDSAYQFGHFEIHVEPDHVMRALKIINEEIKF